MAVRHTAIRRTAHCQYGIRRAVIQRMAYGVRHTASTAYGNTAYGSTVVRQYGIRHRCSTAYSVRRTAVRRTAYGVRQYGVRQYGSTAYGTPSRSSRTPPQCVIWCWLPSRTRSTRRHPGRILLPIEYPSLEILLMECVFSIEFLLIHSSGRPRGFLIMDFLLIPIV